VDDDNGTEFAFDKLVEGKPLTDKEKFKLKKRFRINSMIGKVLKSWLAWLVTAISGVGYLGLSNNPDIINNLLEILKG